VSAKRETAVRRADRISVPDQVAVNTNTMFSVIKHLFVPTVMVALSTAVKLAWSR
jgi:hypothetical protein